MILVLRNESEQINTSTITLQHPIRHFSSPVHGLQSPCHTLWSWCGGSCSFAAAQYLTHCSSLGTSTGRSPLRVMPSPCISSPPLLRQLLPLYLSFSHVSSSPPHVSLFLCFKFSFRNLETVLCQEGILSR